MVPPPHGPHTLRARLASQGNKLAKKLSALRSTEDKVGLIPEKGWQQRNLQFLGDVLLPTLLSPRAEAHEVDPIPHTELHQIGVTWLGHAGFLIQMQGTTVLVDPNWAMWHGPVKRVRHPSLEIEELPRIDLVLITHAHFDHLHLPTLKKIAAGQPIVLPTGCGDLVQKCAFSKVIELGTWEGYSFRDLRVTLTPARHWGARMLHDTHREFGGYLIQSTERTVYHCGDSAPFDGFSEIAKRASIDVGLLPIGAYDAPSGRPVHMNPEEALDAFHQLGAALMVPMHYDTFPLGGEPLHEPANRLVSEAQARGIADRVWVMREGESLVL